MVYSRIKYDKGGNCYGFDSSTGEWVNVDNLWLNGEKAGSKVFAKGGVSDGCLLCDDIVLCNGKNCHKVELVKQSEIGYFSDNPNTVELEQQGKRSFYSSKKPNRKWDSEEEMHSKEEENLSFEQFQALSMSEKMDYLPNWMMIIMRQITELAQKTSELQGEEGEFGEEMKSLVVVSKSLGKARVESNLVDVAKSLANSTTPLWMQRWNVAKLANELNAEIPIDMSCKEEDLVRGILEGKIKASDLKRLENS